MTLRTRIAAVASVSVALAVLAAAIGLYAAVGSDLRGELDSTLRDRAHAFTGPRPRPPDDDGPGDGPGEQGGLGFPGTVRPTPFGAASGYVQFVSREGGLQVPGGQGASSATIPLTASDRSIAARGSGMIFTDRDVKGTRLRVLTAGTGSLGAVMVARPLTEVEHELSHLLVILVLIGAGGIVLAALLGTLVARTALAPIARFTSSTEALTAGAGGRGETDAHAASVDFSRAANFDLSRRLQVSGRDELGRLAGSFNATLDALERSVAAQRHLVADASHELRTPIASLRANIQTLGEAGRLPAGEQEALRADIVAELDELTALVADVVELARGADSREVSDGVRLDELVRAAVESARRRGGVSYAMDLQETVVTGEPARIARAVSNLVDNARKWSPEGGTVELRLGDGVLSVRDHGPGFAQEDLPFVFDRFYRAQAARGLPGSGLGLAIVRQTAEACGGFVEAANAPGGGALLRVGFGPPGRADDAQA